MIKSKKVFIFVFSLVLIFSNIGFCFASSETTAELTCNDKTSIEANVGDTLLIEYKIYGDSLSLADDQNEIAFDNTVFDLVEGSNRIVERGYQTSVHTVDNISYVYFNTMNSHTVKKNGTVIGSFKLKVKDTNKDITSIISNENTKLFDSNFDKVFVSLNNLTVSIKAKEAKGNTDVSQDVSYILRYGANDTNKGSISCDYSSGSKVTKGEKVELIAKAKSGYIFEKWSTGETSSKIKVTMTGNKSLIAYFKKIENILDAPKPTSESVKLLKFKDINSSAWYYNAVSFVNEEGIMSGTSNDKFSPELPMTRGMFVTTLYRLVGSPDTNLNNSFSDVKKNAYYYKAVTWASLSNITSGVSEFKFMPDSSITREQAITMLKRFADYSSVSPNKNSKSTVFLDESKVSSYAKDSIKWGIESNILSGVSTKKGLELQPQGLVTRAQMAQILMNYIKSL